MPIEVDGAARLQATMNEAARELGQLADAHRETAALIVRAARPPRRTGVLAASIRVQPDPAAAEVTVTARYAGAVHGGVPSRGIRANPFLTRAVSETQGGWTDIYMAAIQKTLDTVKGA